MSEMHDILNRLQQLNESAQPVTEGKMPSKKHVMDMCKDGKSEKEMLEMHADADKDKLKDLIKTCKEEMKDSKQSAIAEGVARIEQRLLKEFAEFAESTEEQVDEVMPFVKMTYKEIQDNIKRTRQEIELGHRDDIKMLKPYLRDLLDMKDVVKVILNNKGWGTEYIVGAMMDSGLDTSVREELAEKFKKQVSKDPQLAKKLFKDPQMEGSMKHMMHADAERMSREEFVDEYGEEHGEFWDNIMGELDEGKAFAASGVRADKRGKYNTAPQTFYHVKLEKDNVTKAERILASDGDSESDVKSNAKRDNPGWKIVSVRKLDETAKQKAKPDYIDLDGDGDKKEPMKKAAKDKKKKQG